jgi:hypothetical protein
MSSSLSLTDPRLYIPAWLSAHGVTVSESGQLIEPSASRPLNEIFDSMWLDLGSQVRAYNVADAQKPKAERKGPIRPINERDLQKALNELIAKAKASHRANTIRKLACTGDNIAHVESFLTALTGHANPLQVAAFCHWLWQVKRKMLGKDIAHHLMIVFRGKQGCGKSTAILKALNPIQAYTLMLDFDQLKDQRHWKALSENYVIFLDEMSGVERSEAAQIKRLVSIPTLDYKPLYSNDNVKIRQACSFLGATNLPVNELLPPDRSGMRRYLEIVTLDTLNHDLINSIDYLALWQGIDEAKESGYITEFLSELREKQKDLITEDDIETFINEHNLKPVLPGETIEVPFEIIYDAYRVWCDQNGIKAQSSNWVGRKLVNRGLPQPKQKKVSGKNMKVYTLNSLAALPTQVDSVLAMAERKKA